MRSHKKKHKNPISQTEVMGVKPGSIGPICVKNCGDKDIDIAGVKILPGETVSLLSVLLRACPPCKINKKTETRTVKEISDAIRKSINEKLKT